MTSYSQLLRNGADEVLRYARGLEGQPDTEPTRFDRLADAMRQSAELNDLAAAERAIRGIARSIIDRFPLSSDYAPSFQLALHAVHVVERTRRRDER